MRVLTSATGSVTHLEGRERVVEYAGAPSRLVRAEGPVCNGIGAARGNVRWYEREAKAITCKRCLAILEKAHAEALTENELRDLKAIASADLAEVEAELAEERAAGIPSAARRPATQADMFVGNKVFKGNGKTAYRVWDVREEKTRQGTRMVAGLVKASTVKDPSVARGSYWAASALTVEVRENIRAAELEAHAMHAQYMATPEGQAQEEELTGRRAEKCARCGQRRSKPRHHSAEGHPFVPAEAAPQSALADLGEDGGMVVDLHGQPLVYVKPGDRLRHFDTGSTGTVTAVGPNAVDLTMDDGTRRSGASWHWGHPPLSEPAAELPEVAPALVIDPDKYDSNAQLAEATAQARALREAERARLTDAARVLSRMAEPGQVAELARSIAERAEAFAAGTVPTWGHEAFRLRMEKDAATLASWLGMSTPVKLDSYASPYGGTGLVDDARKAHGGSLEVSSARIVEGVRAARTRVVSMPMCRVPSSRWVTYGAPCNIPLNTDGTCPEHRFHV